MTLSYNALLVARIIDAFGGFLIYTGGDDVLAIIPPEVWHLVYMILRFTFSSEIILNKALGRYKEGIYHYGMGWRASQSYGIVIAHHKADFRWVIELSRELEEKSKDLLVGKEKAKDATTIALLGRGAKIRVVGPIPNILIKHEDTYKTLHEYDSYTLDRVRNEVNSVDVFKTYMNLVDPLMVKVECRDLSDYVFIGIAPRSSVLNENMNNFSTISLVSLAYRIARYVLDKKLSRGGLGLLEELLAEKTIKDGVLEEEKIYLLKYQLSRKIPCEDIRAELSKELIHTIKEMSRLSIKFKTNLLALFSLSEVFRRCLGNQI